MPDNSPGPQFSTAEYQPKPTSDSCRLCRQPIGETYYRVGDSMLCPSCTDKVRRERPEDSHSAFFHAVLLGIGAAILGLIFYAAFAILTGIIIGYVSLAVGYFIAKAMMMGSNGVGGRRYQITAVILTYAAVSVAAIPIQIHYYSAERKSDAQRLRAANESAANHGELTGESKPPDPPAPKPPIDLGSFLLKLAMLGLASPFLELQAGLDGVIGLVILFVGIRIAWKMTAGKPAPVIFGPLTTSPPVR